MKKLLVLCLLAGAGVAVTSAANAQEAPLNLKDLQACYQDYKTPRGTRVNSEGQEEAFVLENYVVSEFDTGWEPIGTDHRRSTLAKRFNLCYQWMGTWGAPWASGERADIEASGGPVSYHQLAGGTWTFGAGVARAHENRFPVVWPSSNFPNMTQTATGGTLLKEYNSKIGGYQTVYGYNACDFALLNQCHTPIIGSLGIDAVDVGARDTSWHGVRLGKQEQGYDDSPCQGWFAQMTVILSGQPSAYQDPMSPYTYCIVLADGSRAFPGTNARAQHQTKYDGLVGSWVPCVELSPYSAAEAGCNGGGLIDDDGDEGDGEDPNDPATPPEVTDPGTRTPGCVLDCSFDDAPSEDPARFWIRNPLAPPTYDCGDKSIDPGAEAEEFANATVGWGNDGWYEAYAERYRLAERARNRVCVQPETRSPSYPPAWETPELEVFHTSSWNSRHRYTQDFQHIGIIQASCDAFDDECAEHPEIVIHCETDRCGLNQTVFFDTGAGSAPAGGYRIVLDEYLVNRNSLISRWDDGRPNWLWPDHYSDGYYKEEFRGSPEKGAWHALDNHRNNWDEMAVDGVAFRNATTGGYQSRMSLAWYARVFIRGNIEAWSYDQWGRRLEWSEPWTVEALVRYEHADGVPFDHEQGMTIGTIIR